MLKSSEIPLHPLGHDALSLFGELRRFIDRCTIAHFQHLNRMVLICYSTP